MYAPPEKDAGGGKSSGTPVHKGTGTRRRGDIDTQNTRARTAVTRTHARKHLEHVDEIEHRAPRLIDHVQAHRPAVKVELSGLPGCCSARALGHCCYVLGLGLDQGRYYVFGLGLDRAAASAHSTAGVDGPAVPAQGHYCVLPYHVPSTYCHHHSR